jgi:hypothetical protein
VTSGVVALTGVNQRAEFSVATPSSYDRFDLNWKGPLPADRNWDAVLTVHNHHSPTTGDSSIGLGLQHPTTDERVYVELNAFPSSRGFLSALETDTNIFGEVYTNFPNVTNSAVRLSYNAVTKVITASIDRDGPGSAFGWQVYATFGLAGSGGATANRDWNLSSSNKFTLGIGAFAETTVVASGLVWADDFALTISEFVPPILNILREGSGVRFIWPGEKNVFALQSCNVLGSGSWMAVTNQPQTAGTNLTLLVPIQTNSMFFRLAY